MKVLLINPPITSIGEIKIANHPPLGLAYLAAYIRQQTSFKVKILDALVEGKNYPVEKKYFRSGLTDKQIKNIIRRYNPDVVGVSLMFTPYYQDGIRMNKLAKEVNPKIITVAGGAHTSSDPQKMIELGFDLAVFGEGEETFLEVLKEISNKQKVKSKKKESENLSLITYHISPALKQINGLAYKSPEDKVVINPPRSLIKNLDTLPFPAWELLPMKKYDRPEDLTVMKHPLFSVTTSRGCPGHCVYCSVQTVWGRTWRGRSPKNVVDEIEILIKKYGIREIHFMDDSLSVNKGRLTSICEEIIKRKLKFKWATPNGIAHWTLDEALVVKMKQAGCYRLTFGIESGNPQMRAWLGKPYGLKQADRLIRYANRIGLWTIATFILGFPYETKKQINQTINYAIKSDLDFTQFYRLSPKPGTKVYKIFERENLLPADEELCLEGQPVDTVHFTKEELTSLRAQAYRDFLRSRIIKFANPLRIINKIRSLDDLQYILKIIFLGLSMSIGFLFRRNSQVTSKQVKGNF